MKALDVQFHILIYHFYFTFKWPNSIGQKLTSLRLNLEEAIKTQNLELIESSLIEIEKHLKQEKRTEKDKEMIDKAKEFRKSQKDSIGMNIKTSFDQTTML